VAFLGWELERLGLVLGIIVEIAALLCVPLVLLRRKEPSSTAAWILALIFLPCLGTALFLLFGRERVRLPAQWKLDADRALASLRPRRHPRLVTDADAGDPAPLHRDLFRVGNALEGAEPTEGNAVELLVDGNTTYDALGAAIDAAKHYVHAEYYLIRRDATAGWLRERLIAAAKRGVRVRLLVDGYGSFWLTPRWRRPLRAAGAQMAFFLPARLLFLQPMNLRNHRKIVVVDGEVAFTGGINVGNEYRGAAQPWRDTHLRLRGPVVRDLARVFGQDWHFATRRPLPAEEAIDEQPEPADAPGTATIAVVRSGPDLQGAAREAIHRVFFSAITLARTRVQVTTPYFIPDRSIVVALQAAALRGVDVRLLLPSRSNHRVVFQAGRSFYEELLEAGVGIYEYGPGMIHAKTMVVDGTVSLVGSANMDVRSFKLNFEVHTVIRDAPTAAGLEDCFEADLRVSPRIDAAVWRQRGRLQRVVEGVARLLSPLM
jgi:cardiolipin synthase A/B